MEEELCSSHLPYLCRLLRNEYMMSCLRGTLLSLFFSRQKIFLHFLKHGFVPPGRLEEFVWPKAWVCPAVHIDAVDGSAIRASIVYCKCFLGVIICLVRDTHYLNM